MLKAERKRNSEFNEQWTRCSLAATARGLGLDPT